MFLRRTTDLRVISPVKDLDEERAEHAGNDDHGPTRDADHEIVELSHRCCEVVHDPFIGAARCEGRGPGRSVAPCFESEEFVDHLGIHPKFGSLIEAQGPGAVRADYKEWRSGEVA
jgi:hypothetical protein